MYIRSTHIELISVVRCLDVYPLRATREEAYRSVAPVNDGRQVIYLICLARLVSCKVKCHECQKRNDRFAEVIS